MSNMDDLVQFLRDRLDEDETLAQNNGQWSTSWQDLTTDGELRDDANAGTVAYIPHVATRTHIARHDPARVLAQVTAVRGVLTEYDESAQAAATGNRALTRGTANMTLAALKPVLAHLATAYAHHPDYQADWSPRSSWS
ncbi:DUF6221 family protein [Streptomyces sp. NPDC056004]|uniref:DUF6221 family protein n=1 Tax=Streptomyces sp. NPDC056004 TaxID=3345677 RepID=UPI0035D64899